jgi:phosphate transport system protein
MSRTQYDEELESIRQNLIRMGETTESLFSEALRAVTEPSPASLAKASELEAQTDHQHRLIHDQCLTVITRRAPVARDARLVTGILDAIVDLELMGDYAYEIVALSSSIKGRPPSQILAQTSRVGTQIQEILTTVIDSWRGGDGATVGSVRPAEPAIRGECRALYEKLSQLTSLPGDATMYVDLMLISRHFERILRHAVCVADQAVNAAPLDEARQGV